MGCLNSTGQFSHWFGNIHLSGPCNRSCYWCIGQYMMALDASNVLDTWPLPNIDAFIARCKDRGVSEVNLTGTNTDPLMYRHIPTLVKYLREQVPGLKMGLRTNGALALSHLNDTLWFDKLSLSVHSLDPETYIKIMGNGKVPDIKKIVEKVGDRPLKVNVVLCPENIKNNDVWQTVFGLIQKGIKKINLREPYGQPHVGNPFSASPFSQTGTVLGMPQYDVFGCSVVYWDVHYVEVESVNLYANGNISEDYPITRGHDAKTGDVKDQTNFKGGRVREQWLNIKKKPVSLT